MGAVMFLIYPVLVSCLQHFTFAFNEYRIGPLPSTIGNTCELSDQENGTCAMQEKCLYAQELAKQGFIPYLCGFEGNKAVVCCKEEKEQDLFFISEEESKNTCDVSDGEKEECVVLEKCPYAQNLLKKGSLPRLCGFEGKSSMVCCKEEKNQEIRLKPGDLSTAKCDEYYPESNVDWKGLLVPGAKPSLAREFPHMAVIGFGEKDNIQWQCGGSLISERFVLTAAHCLQSREMGPAKFVRLGDLNLTSDTDVAEPQDFTIKRNIPHPDFNPPSKYNDIALVELDREIIRSSYVSMACLDTKRRHDEKSMIATGWGKTEFLGDASSFLLKTDLDIADYETCKRAYATAAADKLPRGILDEMHICAGGKPEQDTCQGDSGGPLQVRVQGRWKRFRNFGIVGITAFGKACGISGAPGVYTRVYNYLDWIEKTVWTLRTIDGGARNF